ncbi:MAG: hypothetical protein GC192_06160 [Bacteroidetes bacterium]|nr:hypothetical protein [Bacteroidota bacterium]
MKLISKIKYKKDDNNSDFQLKVLVFSIVVSIFITPLSRSIIILAIVCIIILLEIIILSKKNGLIKLYEKDGDYELSIEDKGKPVVYEKILSYKFRWSYNYIPFVKRDVGTPKAAHVNYIFIRVEFTFVNGKRIILGKELNQWKSTPTNWEYEVLITEGSEFLGITSYDLVKLKKEIDLLASNHS